MRDFEELALERLDGLAQKAIEAGAMPDDRGYAFFVVVLLAIFGTAIGLDVLFIDE